jgi:hypothetical protein
MRLQVHPELAAGAEILTEPQRGLGGDRTLAAHDVGQPIGRHA